MFEIIIQNNDFSLLFSEDLDNKLIVKNNFFNFIDNFIVYRKLNNNSDEIDNEEDFFHYFESFNYPYRILKEFYIMKIIFDNEEDMFYFKMKYM